MNLLGIKVKHKVWGLGEIIEINGKYIKVSFSSESKSFVYPDAFENFIQAVDEEVQSSIANEINEIKKAKEEEKRKLLEEIERKKNLIQDKALDAMFGPDYHSEKLAREPILTYEQVEDVFGIRISGFGRGINPTATTVVLISSIKKDKGYFVYHDKWTADGDYIYSGEGRVGDQKMTKGNLAIKNAALDGKKIHLLVKFSPQEYYYQGVFVLADYTYEDDKDENGDIRKEFKFRLRKVR